MKLIRLGDNENEFVSTVTIVEKEDDDLEEVTEEITEEQKVIDHSPEE